ncbi:MAG: GNAT family N-acetyltransferase [Proteobacteria bacterium]|nr:GNAT family N-acetyltransferase [Pseudomonadota bacterium]
MKDSLTKLAHSRLAQAQDLEFIYQCLLSLFEEEGNLEKLSQSPGTLFNALFSENAFAQCIIAEINQKPVGILLFSVTQHNFTAFPSPGIFVHDIYVLPDYRRQGVARLLGDAIKKFALAKNYSRIDGIILKNNQNALAFYRNIQDLQVLDYIYYTRLNLK